MAATHPAAMTTLNVGLPSNSSSLSAGIQSAASTNSSVSSPYSNGPARNVANRTSTPIPAGSGPSSPLVTPPVALQKGRTGHTFKSAFSSNHLNVFFSVIALAVGGYYFFAQYILAKKAYETSLWKDCHDRDDIANTSVCHRLSEISYDKIAKRWAQVASAGAGVKRGIKDCLTASFVLYVLWIGLIMVDIWNDHLVRSYHIDEATDVARCEYDDHGRRCLDHLDDQTHSRVWMKEGNRIYDLRDPRPPPVFREGLIRHLWLLIGVSCALIMFPTASEVRTAIRNSFPRSFRDIPDFAWEITGEIVPTAKRVFLIVIFHCGGPLLRLTLPVRGPGRSQRNNLGLVKSDAASSLQH